MSAQVATLNVSINASTAGLGQGIRSATQQVNSFASSTNGIGSSIQGLGANLAGIVAGFVSVQKAVESFVASVERADTLDKMSVRLGTTVNQLAKLQYAASLAKVETGELQGFLEHMARTVASDALSGEQLLPGLDAKALSALPIDEMLKKVGEAISQIDNYAERSKAATEIFGRGGAAMIPLFEGGANSIKAMTDQAERQGKIISDLTNAKIVMMADAWGAVQKDTVSISDHITGAMAPGLTAILQNMTGMNLQGQGFKLAMDGISAVIEHMGASLATQIDFVSGIFYTIDGIVLGISGAIIDAVASIMKLIPGLQDLSKEWAAFGGSFMKSGDEFIVQGHKMVADAITGNSYDNFKAQVAKLKSEAEVKANKARDNAKHSAGIMIEAGEKTGDAIAKKIREAQAPGALERGSREAFSASAAARRSGTEPVVEAVKVANREQVRELQAIKAKIGPQLPEAGL